MKCNSGLVSGSLRIACGIAIATVALVLQGCATAPDLSAQGPQFKCHRIGAKFRQSCSPVIEASPSAPSAHA
jgi:hypothetical protein